MEVSLYSLLMAILWSSTFILLLFAVRRVTNLIVRFGMLPMVALFLGCIIRIAFPWDIHGFTEPIVSTRVYAAVNTLLYQPLLPESASGPVLTPIWILLGVWIAGTAVYLFHDTRQYLKDLHQAHIRDDCEDEAILSQAQEIADQLNIKHFHLLQDPGVRIPYVCGFLYPRVFLPVGNYTEKEYEYSLLHEFNHWKNRDMIVRALALLFCDVFWWNPCSYLLLKDMNHTLEMRCDASVVGDKSAAVRTEYVETLFSMVEKAVLSDQEKKKRRVRMTSQLSGEEFDKKRFEQRVTMAIQYKTSRKRDRLVIIFMTALLAVLLTFSYRYIIQPGYEVPTDDLKLNAGYTRVVNTDGYLVRINDNTYEVYIGGNFAQEVDKETADMMLQDGFVLREN